VNENCQLSSTLLTIMAKTAHINLYELTLCRFSAMA